MPIYDYACENCGHRFEARQSFSDDPLTICPECQGHIRRVIHASGIIFKGSGWYVTDSRDAKSAAVPAVDSSSSDSSSSSEPSKSESSASDSTKIPSTASDSKTSESKTSDSKAAADS
jgi:putative FmdB family regulatory protein